MTFRQSAALNFLARNMSSCNDGNFGAYEAVMAINCLRQFRMSLAGTRMNLSSLAYAVTNSSAA
jgi:hypothetical protein